MKEIISYTVDELSNEHNCIIINTQKGVSLSISVEHGVTKVLLPFGNKIEKPEKYGNLSKGIVVLPQK